MQLGMIGLGRMGANMVRRLQKNKHQCVVYDRSAESVKQLASEGPTGSSSLDDFLKKLAKPRASWRMAPPAGLVAILLEPPPQPDSADSPSYWAYPYTPPPFPPPTALPTPST